MRPRSGSSHDGCEGARRGFDELDVPFLGEGAAVAFAIFYLERGLVMEVYAETASLRVEAGSGPVE